MGIGEKRTSQSSVKLALTNLIKEVIMMEQSPEQTGSSRSRRATLVLIAVGGACLALALILGIADNPPGLALVYLAVTSWIVALAHRWRRLKSFLILLVASLVVFPLTVILHNLFYALRQMAGDVVLLAPVLGFLEGAFFLIAVLVCPPGAVVGAAGSVVLAIQHFRGQTRSDENP
jgi:hypothetical protein